MTKAEFCRDKFSDKFEWEHVYIGNCYQLPNQFEPGDCVLDCGGHIGTFALGCLERGAGKVLSVEADPRNFGKLSANLAGFAGRWVGMNAAVLGNAANGSDVTFYGFDDADPNSHTTCGSAVIEGRNPIRVRAVSLSELLRMEPAWRFVKIDIEGAEYTALYSCTELERVRQIIIEPHDVGDGFANTHNVHGLLGFLSAQGMKTSIVGGLVVGVR